MSASNIITASVDLARGVRLVRLGRLFASGDKSAHTISVTVLNDGAAADLSGQTVKGYFIRADDATVTINGTLSGNVATVTLPNSCYAVSGHFQLIIKALSTNVNTAIFWADGTITRSSTDIIVDPDHIIPSLEELLAKLDDMDAAETAANTAAAAANTAATTANTAASTATTAAGTANTAATAASAAAQQVTDAIIPDLSDVTTNTIAAGLNASVIIDTDDEGTPHNPKLTFNIPRGADGQGDVESVDGISPVNGDVTLPVMTGATSSANGAAGKVPAPSAGDEDKYLSGAGTWEDIPDTYVLPTAGADTKGGVRIGSGLHMGGATGETLSVPEFGRATAVSAGTAGLVPAPAAGDQLKFLRGDKSWVTIEGGGGSGGYTRVSCTAELSHWTGSDQTGWTAVMQLTTTNEYAYGYFIPLRCGQELLTSPLDFELDNAGNVIMTTATKPRGAIEIEGLIFKYTALTPTTMLEEEVFEEEP